MSTTDSRSYCRVVIVAPNARVDLALPADVPLIDLLPSLLDYAGERRDDGGGSHGGWRLTRNDRGELDGGRTLRALDVVDGDMLRLVHREAPTAPPVFDDVIDSIAATVRARINSRSANPGVTAAAVVAILAVAALAVFLRRPSDSANAYLSAAVTVVTLAVAATVARGTGGRILGTAIAAGAIPFVVLCGLDVDGQYGRWGLVLGAVLAFVYVIVAAGFLVTGTVVFAAAATAALLAAVAALVAGLSHEPPLHIVAGTVAVALGALAFLPQLSMRLARLPLGTVPTNAEELAATDDTGDLADITARARVASEYLLGTTIGCAAVVGVCGALLAADRRWMPLTLAGCALAAMAMRARSQPTLGARIALIVSAVAGLVAGGTWLAVTGTDADRKWVLAGGLIAAAATITLGVLQRVQISPQARRISDWLESLLVIAVLPLAVGVIGLYSTLRHL